MEEDLGLPPLPEGTSTFLDFGIPGSYMLDDLFTLPDAVSLCAVRSKSLEALIAQ